MIKVLITKVLMASIGAKIDTKVNIIIAAGGDIAVSTNEKIGNARIGPLENSDLAIFIILDLKTKSGEGGCTVAIYDGKAHGHCLLDGTASCSDNFSSVKVKISELSIDGK